MRSIARYRAWALREPFVLQVDDDHQVVIDRPTPDGLLKAASADTLRMRLAVLAGKSARPLLEVLGPLDIDVTRAVVDEMAEHFGCTGVHRLVRILDRYGDAIAADLDEVYGLDLLDLFRGAVLPDELLSRIDNLPRHSRFAEAIAQDDELAESMGDAPVGSTASVKFTEWTPEVERLTVIANSLGAIFQAVASFAGSRAQLPQLSGPSGASDRFKLRQLQQEFDEIVADVEAAQRRDAETNTDTNTEEG